MIEREHRAVFTEQLQQRRRGRGRPRNAAPRVSTRVELPADVFDALCRRASEERKSLHAFLRESLESQVRSTVVVVQTSAVALS
jgi:hypothetical protein